MNRSESHRKYTINENFFDFIDSEEKAYFLGLLYADGYNNEKKGCIQLVLKETDKSILEKLNILIDSNRPLQFIEYKNSKFSNQYGLNISNRYISSKLSSLGCTQKKSNTLSFPMWIDQKLQKHFIRGYFDGDGCIHIGKQIVVNLTGNNLIINTIQDILSKELDLRKTKLQINKRGDNSIVTMQYSGINQARKIGRWLYEDSLIYLSRKFDKFKTLINA